MKKIVFLSLLLVTSVMNAQITFEHAYSNTSYLRMGLVQLTSSGYKYVNYDTSQIVLYNLNHTVFRTIQLPMSMGNSSFFIYDISEELFNLNPNDIEYLIEYRANTGSDYSIRVFDEAGNTLFARDSCGISNTGTAPFRGIAYSSGGVKLIVQRLYTNITEIYSLPGFLPCNECSSGVISGLQEQPGTNETSPERSPAPYPNPASSVITVPYRFPPGEHTGFLVFYDLSGREIKRFSVTDAFQDIQLSVADLAAGTYLYQIETRSGIIPGNKIVVSE